MWLNGLTIRRTLQNLHRHLHLIRFLTLNSISIVRRGELKTLIEKAYKFFLCRAPDEMGFFHYANKPKNRNFLIWRLKLIWSIWKSSECSCIFMKKWGYDLNEIHHRARIKMIKSLPEAKNILDLGGGCSYSKSGSLLAMGYPYMPEKITIIDFPPEERMASSKSNLREDVHATDLGTKVHFIYDSFINLYGFLDNTFDMVVSGQTIEHISPDEAKTVFKEVCRILKPGGYFCLDTPNRAVTKMIIPNGYIHPEHKIEYHVDELVNLAKSFGYKLNRSLAISPMPKSCRRNIFDYLELGHSDGLSNESKTGYSFYLELQKPL